MRAILSFNRPRCAIITCLNMINTKFRRAMIVQLNKIWRVWACARVIAGHSRPGLHCSGVFDFDFVQLSVIWFNELKVGLSPSKKKFYLLQ